MSQYVYILQDDHHNQFTPIATYRYTISFSLMRYFKIHSPKKKRDPLSKLLPNMRCSVINHPSMGGVGVRTGLGPTFPPCFYWGLLSFA